MSTYWSDYYRCHRWFSGTHCGMHGNRATLFTAPELESRTTTVFHYTISEYVLIKTRCGTFQDNCVLCPWHRYLLCEGYIPEPYCIHGPCYNRIGLIQLSVQPALFITNVPIRKHIHDEILDSS